MQAPIPLIEIHLTETLRLSDRDIRVDGSLYKRGVTACPALSESLPDLFYGAEEVSDIVIEFSNGDTGVDDTWAEIVTANELRGKSVTLYEYTDTGGKLYRASGVISGWTHNRVFTLRINMRRDAGLERLIPRELVTTDRFHETAMDAGKPVNICIGCCYDVPCPCIRNDVTNGIYDYLIGYAPIQGIQTGAGLGVKRDGVLVNTVEWVLLNNSVYPGYAVIRFTVQQKTHSGGYHAITADLLGLTMGGASAQRNIPMVIAHFLSNAAWGLGLTINSASFTAAAAALTTGDGWYCDGCISRQQQARDYLDQFMFPLVQIERGPSGWEAAVDGGGKSSVAAFDETGTHNPAVIYDVSVTDTSEALKTITVHYRFNSDPSAQKPYQEMVRTVTDLDLNPRVFGIEKTWELPFVAEHSTAKNVVSYLHNRAIYSDRRARMRTGIAGNALKRGDVVTLYKPSAGIDGEAFQIESAVKSSTEWEFGLVSYDDFIFGGLVLDTPADWIGDDVEVSEPNTLIGTVNLGDGANNVGTIICNNSSGQKVGITAAGTGDDSVRFWAGATFLNRGTAPFRVTQAGAATASNIAITGGTLNGTATATVVNNASAGSLHAATQHAAQDADKTETIISGGLVTTGTLQVYNGTSGLTGGITGNGVGDSYVRFWAGSTFENRASAPFRVTQAGAVTCTNITITGGTLNGTATATVVNNASAGSLHAATQHAAQDADKTETIISSGLVTTGTLQVYNGTSGLTGGITGNGVGDSYVRFWAGSTFENRASAPFRVTQAGAVTCTNITITGGTLNGTATATVVNNASAGSLHAATQHAVSDADKTSTIISSGLVTTGTIQVYNGTSGLTGGITGNGVGDSYVRFWAGSTFENRASAPFRVTQAGAVTCTNITITGGTINGTAASTVVSQAYAGSYHASSVAHAPSDADKTANNTAYDTARVYGITASTIAGWKYANSVLIDGGQIYAGTVTAYQIAANTITADKIAANTITLNKLNAADTGSITFTGCQMIFAAGADLVLKSTDGNPSLIQYQGESGFYWDIQVNSGGLSMSLGPNSNSGVLQLGYNSSYTALWTYVKGSTGVSITGGSTVYAFKTDMVFANALVSFGSQTYPWNSGFFNELVLGNTAASGICRIKSKGRGTGTTTYGIDHQNSSGVVKFQVRDDGALTAATHIPLTNNTYSIGYDSNTRWASGYFGLLNVNGLGPSAVNTGSVGTNTNYYEHVYVNHLHYKSADQVFDLLDDLAVIHSLGPALDEFGDPIPVEGGYGFQSKPMTEVHPAITNYESLAGEFNAKYGTTLTHADLQAIVAETAPAVQAPTIELTATDFLENGAFVTYADRLDGLMESAYQLIAGEIAGPVVVTGPLIDASFIEDSIFYNGGATTQLSLGALRQLDLFVTEDVIEEFNSLIEGLTTRLSAAESALAWFTTERLGTLDALIEWFN